jgi:hypothetical protein
MTDAPDFNPGYPSRGELIGPAWVQVWAMLADHEWRKGMDLAATVAERCGVAAKTVQNLLSQATKVGLLERETRFAGKVGGYRSRTTAVRPAWFRRAS